MGCCDKKTFFLVFLSVATALNLIVGVVAVIVTFATRTHTVKGAPIGLISTGIVISVVTSFLAGKVMCLHQGTINKDKISVGSCSIFACTIFACTLVVTLAFDALMYASSVYIVVTRDENESYDADEYRWNISAFAGAVILIGAAFPCASILLHVVSQGDLSEDCLFLWLYNVSEKKEEDKSKDSNKMETKAGNGEEDKSKDSNKMEIKAGNGEEDKSKDSDDAAIKAENEEEGKSKDSNKPPIKAENEERTEESNATTKVEKVKFWDNKVKLYIPKDHKGQVMVARCCLWIIFFHLLLAAGFQFFFTGIVEIVYANPGSCDKGFDCFHSVISILKGENKEERCQKEYSILNPKSANVSVLCIRFLASKFGFASSFYTGLAIGYALVKFSVGVYGTIFKGISFLCGVIDKSCHFCGCSKTNIECTSCCCCCCTNAESKASSSPKVLAIVVTVIFAVLISALIVVAVFAENESIPLIEQSVFFTYFYVIVSILAMVCFIAVLFCLQFDSEGEKKALPSL